MYGDDDFDTLAFYLSDLYITDARVNPTTIYLDHGTGLADSNDKNPDLIACSCTTLPRDGEYCWVEGKNASGEYLYQSRLQYVATVNGLQYFRFQK